MAVSLVGNDRCVVFWSTTKRGLHVNAFVRRKTLFSGWCFAVSQKMKAPRIILVDFTMLEKKAVILRVAIKKGAKLWTKL
jgi:hypothetical protein